MSRTGQGHHCPGHGFSCRQPGGSASCLSPGLDLSCDGYMGFFQLAGLDPGVFSHHGPRDIARRGFGTWCCDPHSPPSSPSSDLQLHLDNVTAESQEKVDTQAATIAKLNKVLRTKLEVSQKWASAHPRAEPNWDRR